MAVTFRCASSGKSAVDEIPPLGGDLVDRMLCRLEKRVPGNLDHMRPVLLNGLHQVVLHKQRGNLNRLPPVNRGRAVHQPIRRSLAGKGVFEDLAAHLALRRHLDAREAIPVIIERVGIGRAHAALHVGSIRSDKSPENDLDGASVGEKLVGLSVSFQADQLGQRVSNQFGHLLLLNAVSGAEAIEDRDALGCQLPHRALHCVVGLVPSVGRLNEARLEESLANGAGHVLGHGKGCGGGRRDDARGVLGIRHAVGLGKFEGTKVVDRIFGQKCVINLGEADAVGRERE